MWLFENREPLPPEAITRGNLIRDAVPTLIRNPLENQETNNVVQSDAAGYVVPPARFELALPA